MAAARSRTAPDAAPWSLEAESPATARAEAPRPRPAHDHDLAAPSPARDLLAHIEAADLSAPQAGFNPAEVSGRWSARRTAAFLIVVNGLFWAGAIATTAWLLRG